MRKFAVLLLVGCGSTDSDRGVETDEGYSEDPAPVCLAMLRCDEVLVGVLADYTQQFDGGLDHPAYGIKGTCWTVDDATAATCESACSDRLDGMNSAVEEAAVATPEECEVAGSGS